jgi:hypothetical protein
MSLTASKVGPYFASGSISFSQLRTNFKKTSSGEVKASELLRVTDTTNTDPIVPDATENSDIATSTNLKTSQFRNSIKYYNLDQGSGDTDLNLDIADSSLWNGNLGKTIVKTVTLAGTSASSTTTTPAATLDAASVYNVLLIITGSVLGDGGAAGTSGVNGGDGGDAIYIDTNSTGTVTIRTSGVSAQVYGGGGGGGYGGAGGTGGQGSQSYSYTVAENRGYYRDQGGNCGCPGSYYCWPGSQYMNGNSDPCCGGGQGTPNECFCCTENVTYSGTNYYNGGSGGSASNGGLGQGYLQTRTFGAASNGGSGGGTNAGSGGSSGASGDGGFWGEDGVDGADGNDGNNGNHTNGTSGQSGTSGGTAGRAVAGSGYTIDTANGVDSAYLGLK